MSADNPHTERETWFADVLLPLPLPGTFTYRVPFDMNGMVKRGCRVVVQFGKQKVYTALVYHLHQNVPQGYVPKYILSILDEVAVVNEQQFKFWQWISSYYLCRLGEVMNAALPSALKLASESRIILFPDARVDPAALTDKEQLLAEALGYRKVLTVTEASEIVERKKIIPLIKTLIEKGIVTLEEELKTKYKPRIETCVRLSPAYEADEDLLRNAMDELNRKAPKQLELLLSYFQMARVQSARPHYLTRAQLLKSVDGSPAQLTALVKKGIFELYELATSRLGQYDSTATVDSILFNPYQKLALEELQKGFETRRVALLHGVTSSGKTEMYIKLIDETIRKGKQVLFLLPEIALTAQIINRLRKYFGNRVGVYHSRYNENERVEIWNSVMNWQPGDEETAQHYSIILGARSAVFLPYRELGLIIVDEENDTSYKQYEPAPRYNARDAAIMLAQIHGALTLLGSATPAIESYYNALNGKYALVELLKRYGDMQLPEILVADIKEETKRKRMHSHFSGFLLDHIKEALKNKEQVILFQNRRGFSLRLECSDCHWIPECKNCDVTLIYHKHNNTIRCHYCGYNIKPPDHCPQCKSTSILMRGFGTEKVAEELAVYFPEARIARLDLDTTRSKHAYHQIISDFEEQKIDILVGTQMVTKGLDFDNVSIAGILSADNMLSFPDFRAFERGFQLMAQVSGRAGRKHKRGKVILQSYDPGHSVIKQVIDNDYKGLYESQIMERRKFRYPPFYRLIRITLKFRDAKVLDKAARELADRLKVKFGKMVLGPEYPMVSRIKGLYLKDILLKLDRNQPTGQLKEQMRIILEEYNRAPDFKSIQLHVDVDPM
jgi:primosomal protein N' (replication factor Y) (superfamily II helicase)